MTTPDNQALKPLTPALAQLVIEGRAKAYTRDGREVRELTHFKVATVNPFVGMVQHELSPDCWEEDGTWEPDRSESDWDLFVALPEPAAQPAAIPTISDYIDNEWHEGDGLPGPAYQRKYGVDSGSDIAMGRPAAQPDKLGGSTDAVTRGAKRDGPRDGRASSVLSNDEPPAPSTPSPEPELRSYIELVIENRKLSAALDRLEEAVRLKKSLSSLSMVKWDDVLDLITKERGK